MRLYLIAPAARSADDDTLENTLAGTKTRYALSAAAGIASVASFFPDEVDLVLCDEVIDRVDFDDPADVIGLSVNVSQMARGIEIAREFRKRGRRVIIGGAHVSLAPDLFEGEADCLVIGEFEPIAAQVVGDLLSGTLKPVYRGGQADMAKLPMPRWDLYPNHKTLAGVVQTSRGCPFDCNFCDVIQYVGRKQRHKPPKAVIAEAEQLYDLGYRHIMLSDDNFTVYRRRSLELLEALAAWNAGRDRGSVVFSTQLSIDLARSPDLLAACNRAGLRYVFIGLETDDEAALEASRKRQNMRIDPREECRRIVAAGLSIRAGLIVGFDSDDLSCFERQFRFAQSLPIVGFNVSALTAPIATPLYDEMKKAGRIVEGAGQGLGAGMASLTNFLPAQMTREQLAEGRRWLKHSLLEADNTIARFEHLAAILGPPDPALRSVQRGGLAGNPLLELMQALRGNKEARRVIDAVFDLIATRPEIQDDLSSQLMLHLNELRKHADRAAAPKDRPNRSEAYDQLAV